MIIVKDGDALKEEIAKAGYSYRALAKEIGCSQTQVSLIVKGERNPSPNNAVKMCGVLNQPFETLFCIKNVNKSKQNNAV